MNHQGFLRIVAESLTPFMERMGFTMDSPQLSGRFYNIDFNSQGYQVSISFEPGDDALLVLVGESRDGTLVDIDD